MKVIPSLLFVVFFVCSIQHSRTAPGRTTDEVLLGEVDIAFQSNNLDVTTEEPFLKKCVIEGKYYSHSQTIPAYDPNSHCLCVAGEVYCWWQKYQSITTESSPTVFSPAWTTDENVISNNHDSKTNPSNEIEASGEPDESIVEKPIENTTNTIGSVKTCVVLGKEYREGETLPHTTGNCVECSCGTEGRIECSPRDCVAVRSRISPDIPEAPDDDFEMFYLDRNINGNF